MEVMAVVVEEIPDPKIDEDPMPKLNMVLDPLRDEDDGPVDTPEVEGAERPILDEMG